jgi:hypothetical protein
MSAVHFAGALALVKVKCLHCLQGSHSFRPMVEHTGSSAKRIRIGLTGLAFAFVFVLLGSAISRSGDDTPVNTINQVEATEPSEPLAELGVAPRPAEPSPVDEMNSANVAAP